MSSTPDDKKTLGQVLSTSSSSSSPFSTPAFNSNGTLGRVLTFEVPKGPMLRRRPGICSERYERERAEFEKLPWYERMFIGTGRDARLEPTDALQSAKTFQRACEQMPDEIPKSALDDKLQQLNDHYSGKNPLPPEQSLELKRRTSFLQDVYTPGPRWENSTSGAESAWLSEQNLRFGNSLGIALLGPLFGAPGAATRVLGGSEQQVAAANQFGASAFDMATAHVGLGGGKRAPEPLPRPGESMRGAPLEPVSRTVEGKPRGPVQEPVPSKTSGAREGTVVTRRPMSPQERAQRLEELAKDPAQGGKATAKTRREAEVGLSMEEQGKLPGPITRDPTGASEFIDATGQKWDVKGWNSQYAPRGYNTPDAMALIQKEMGVGENVIVDTLKMSPQHIGELQTAVGNAGLNNRVIFH
ncbi:hypothetical protein [Variovorax atrisoli]|uniref:hypothetical protein n=1 Tax=Variovorax atrisoli TaxID=3394203 RepID=UPI00036B09E5|nr:hypothetical protein [Variovorax paradoxus]